LIKNTSSIESWRVLTGEKSPSGRFQKRHLIRCRKVLEDVLEEKREEKPLSQPVRGKGITGCESQWNKYRTSRSVFSFLMEDKGRTVEVFWWSKNRVNGLRVLKQDKGSRSIRRRRKKRGLKFLEEIWRKKIKGFKRKTP
jgi:hypothetical protein